MPLVTPVTQITEGQLLAQLQRIETRTELSRQQKRPYISSSMCQRQIMLNGSLGDRSVHRSPAMKYYAAIGNAIESIVVNNYYEAGLLEIHSWKLPKPLFPEGMDLGAKVDMIISYNGTPVLVDIKTIGVVDASAYISLTPEELRQLEEGSNVTILATDERHKFTTNKKIKETYQSQLQLYAAITGLDEIFLLSCSRRVQDGFNLEGNISARFSKIETDEQQLVRRVAVLLFGVMARDLRIKPPPLAGLKKTHCNDAFCSFVSHCWNNEALPQHFDDMTPETEATLKADALEIAKNYIAKRHERRLLTLELLETERKKREMLNAKLNEIKANEVEPLLKEANLYPWDGIVEIKW